MAAKQENNYNTQQAGAVKRCQRFLPICRAKSENKVKKCRPRSVSGTRARCQENARALLTNTLRGYIFKNTPKGYTENNEVRIHGR